MVHIDVIARPGSPPVETGVYTDLIHTYNTPYPTSYPLPIHTITIHTVPWLNNVSSTLVRQSLKQLKGNEINQKIIQNELKSEIYEYIWNSNLYNIDKSDSTLYTLCRTSI